MFSIYNRLKIIFINKHNSPRTYSTKTYVTMQKEKPLFCGRVEIDKSNDPCLPEVVLQDLSQKKGRFFIDTR